jgi:exodeoxyribonuclease VII large subunit
MPGIPVIIYPTAVQGKGAAETIARAINTASKRAECDVLIVCRGGGSMEDLWSFNEEIVARAIASCSIPVVSGVGHETDFTIADFAADRRAPTPTAAAELVSPDRAALLRQLLQSRQKLDRQMRYNLTERMQKLDILSHRLVHPGQRITQRKEQLLQIRARLASAVSRKLELQHAHLQRLTQSLEHLAPHQVLNRGYSLVFDTSGKIVRDSTQLASGDQVQMTFADGQAIARVVETQPGRK